MSEHDTPHLPLPFVPGVTIWAMGRRGQGGVAHLRNGTSDATLALPPALFDTLTILARAVLRAVGDAVANPGFVSVTELCEQLKQLTHGTANPLLPERAQVEKFIFRLRRAVREAFEDKRTPQSPGQVDLRAWAKQLIEYRRFLGYRLAIPPDSIDFRPLDE
jgi:hypothetical protein